MNNRIKRAIAVGLIAITASINPMQTLQPTAMKNNTAKAAESGKAPYVGEVRLSVDKSAKKAKKILADDGYEIIDQDLNEDAGSFLNSLGDQAVYMGIKRTADEKKAIRDMKTMNMLGKYSYTDLKNAIQTEKTKAKKLYEKLKGALKEYKMNYNNGDFVAKQSYKLLNFIREDDSGKTVGDLFLEEVKEEDLITMLAQGSTPVVAVILKELSMACDVGNADGELWTDRLSEVNSYKEILNRYAKEIYGTDSVKSDQKEQVEKMVKADLDAPANVILSRWDEIRGMFTDLKDTEEIEEELQDRDQTSEEFAELSEDMNNVTIADYLKSIKYGKKTLYSYFTLPKSTFEKDITRLYPFVYALSEAQRGIIEYMDFDSIFQAAMTRMGVRDGKKNTEKQAEKKMEDMYKDLKEVSLYEGVDRDMYGENAAMTSRATSKWSSGGAEDEKMSKFEGMLLFMAVFTGFFVVLFTVDQILLPIIVEWVTGIDLLFKDNVKLILKNKAVVVSSIKYLALISGTLFLIVGIWEFVKYVSNKIEEANVKQLPIPEVMVDFDVENNAGKNVTYHSVKWNKMRVEKGELPWDRADRADLNGDAAKQWLALYTTTDPTLGDPILADSIIAKKGPDGKNTPMGYVPLTNFGSESIQNLVDEKYCFNDNVGGIWMCYQKGNANAVIDDTEGDAEYTGSHIGGKSEMLLALGGGTAGLILGVFIGFFIRRKKAA